MLFNSCNNKKTLFLNDINFDDGEYSLIINHKTKGKFWIDNENILKKYKKKSRIKGSVIDYLPGEGNRSYGFILYKDRQVFKAKLRGVFNVFEIGNILDFAMPFDDVFKIVKENKTRKEFYEQIKDFDFKKYIINSEFYYKKEFIKLIESKLKEDDNSLLTDEVELYGFKEDVQIGDLIKRKYELFYFKKKY